MTGLETMQQALDAIADPAWTFRADGYDPVSNRLEEIKTHRGALERMPANHRTLHWAQALVYGHLLCQARGLAELTVALVYFDVGSQKETLLTETHTVAAQAAIPASSSGVACVACTRHQ